jgi:aminopeptidase N
MKFGFSRRAAGLLAALFISTVSLSGQTARPDFNRRQTYDAQHYTIRVSFDQAKRTVFGDVSARVRPLRDGLTEAEFDAVGLRFDSITLEATGKPLKYRAAAAKVTVTLDRAYEAGEDLTIRFKYSVRPRKGVYFVDERLETGGTLHSDQIWTQGEPDEARHWFPSFDFPSDKATTEKMITVPRGRTVIGNGELVSKTENPDGRDTYHFRMAIPHPTYLVSFIVGTYVMKEERYRDIPLRYYVYPGREMLYNTAFGKTREIFAAFEELTGVDYPFNKYDQTIVAKFPLGGMENITATTLSDQDVFYANVGFLRGMVEDLIVHEIAHSWFGNNVTCKNWAELWLNEGFATFMEAAVREKLYGREDYIRKVTLDADEFITDDAKGGQTFGLFNTTADRVDKLFSRPAITYNKGGAVVHMLREQVGNEAFWKGINLYLTRHRFGSVETLDLIHAMEEASGEKLGWFFDQWVYGTSHPKITVRQRYDADKGEMIFEIEQTQKVAGLTPPAFRLPLEIAIVFAEPEFPVAGGPKSDSPPPNQTAVLNITQRKQTISVPVASKPSEVTFDPDSKLPLAAIKAI